MNLALSNAIKAYVIREIHAFRESEQETLDFMKNIHRHFRMQLSSMIHTLADPMPIAFLESVRPRDTREHLHYERTRDEALKVFRKALFEHLKVPP